VTLDAVLALDIGATKFASALVDSTGRVLERRRVRVDQRADAETLFGQLAGLGVRTMSAADAHNARVLGCGVGAAGPITPNLERLHPVNLRAWWDFPLRSRLVEALSLPVGGDLDTKALALGEGWVGGAVGRRDYLSMVVSTGIGGGIVLDGQLLEGESGNAGHIGHVIVVPGGRQCGCGASGCVEAEASGLAITAMTGRPPADAPVAIIERSGRLVGRAVALVMNLLDVPVAFVAGSVALGFGEPFFAAAQAELQSSCRLGDGVRPEILPAQLGADAPLVGAAAVAWRHLGRG
jgi:glucokinase